jgi:hypothetical protein
MVASVPAFPKDNRRQSCATPSFPLRVPDYAVEHRDYTATKPVVLVLQISIPAEDALSEAAMVGLACALASDFSTKENTVQALIFDDRKSAHNLALGFTDQTHYGAYLWHLRGRFEADQAKKQGFVEFVFPKVEDGLLGLGRISVSISDWKTKN